MISKFSVLSTTLSSIAFLKLMEGFIMLVFLKIRLSAVLCIIISLSSCSNDNPTESEPTTTITNINGSWSGSTNQGKLFTFEIEQDNIKQWSITVSGNGVTQRFDATTSVTIIGFKFHLTNGTFPNPTLTLDGEFVSNTRGEGTLKFNGESGTWTANKISESNPTGFPTKPTIVFPQDGQTVDFNKLAIIWTASDPNNDPLTFDFYLGKQSSPPLVSSGLRSNSFEVFYETDELELNTTYYYRISVRDIQGHETTGNILSFKTTSRGDWMKSLNNTAAGLDIETILDGFIVSGMKFIGNKEYSYLEKVDKNGNLLWEQVFNHLEGTEILGNYVIGASDGSYVLATHKKKNSGFEQDMHVLKTDAAGSLLWQKSFSDGKDSYSRQVLENRDGDYLLLGSYQPPDSVQGNTSFIFGRRSRLIKITASGQIE